MTPTQLINCIPLWMLADELFVPCIQGPPGCGKTDVSAQIANAIGHKTGANIAFLTMYPGLDAPEDYKGMPYVIDCDKAEFLPFGQLYRMLTSDDPVVCLIDELGQAKPAVMNAVAQLILNREVNGRPLKNVRFIVATNQAKHFAGVNPMPSQLIDRLWMVEFEPNVDDWCEWASCNGVTPEGVNFIKRHPGVILDFDPDAARLGQKQSSARAFTRVDKILYQNGLMDLPEKLRHEAVQGYLSERDTMDFFSHLELLNEIPRFPDILKDPTGTRLPTNDDVRFILIGRLAQVAEARWIDPIVEYVRRMGEELLSAWTVELEMRQPDLKSSAEYQKLVMTNRNIFGPEVAA